MKKLMLIVCLMVIFNLFLVGCKTEYITLQESKEADKAMIALIGDAPAFPEFMLTPTDFGTWEVSLQGIKSLIEFKLNDYPMYVKSVNTVLEQMSNGF